MPMKPRQATSSHVEPRQAKPSQAKPCLCRPVRRAVGGNQSPRRGPTAQRRGPDRVAAGLGTAASVRGGSSATEGRGEWWAAAGGPVFGTSVMHAAGLQGSTDVPWRSAVRRAPTPWRAAGHACTRSSTHLVVRSAEKGARDSHLARPNAEARPWVEHAEGRGLLLDRCCLSAL